MRSTRRRPSLIGTAARTAVIAGTATAVSGNVARNQQQAAQQQAWAKQAQVDAAVQQSLAQQQAMQQQQATQLPPPVPAGNDEFPAWLIDKYFSAYWCDLGLNRDQFYWTQPCRDCLLSWHEGY